ncbi:EthD domain-containing protein [Croceicoccus pelagius]|uniref:EthD domain-containing protein n=1 Tax=Croceicoccus pelagius TaxID=1703341 RepID=A0A916YNX3_9SPHN|nr:EthD domain-containing protein [Croceicoccus pelagius]GGD54701.1 hypothetical protein GCM10010989_31100 [Croceicoccus pelagius]
MIKFIGASSNPPGVSPEDARTHYELRHPALADSLPSFNKYMLLYIQNYAIDIGVEFSAPRIPFLNCSEIWFKDIDSLLEAYEVPEYQLLREDEKRFGNFDNLGVALAEDVMIFGEDARPRFKLIRFIERNPEIEMADFLEVWQGDYASAMLNSGSVRSLAKTYIQNHALIGAKISFPVKFADGVDEYWFSSPSDIAPFLKAESEVAKDVGIDRIVNRKDMKQIASECRVLPGHELSFNILRKL